MRQRTSAVLNIPLKGPHTDFLDSLPLSFSTGAAAQKAKEISRGELNYLASGRELGAGAVFCQTEVLAEAIAPFLRP